MRDSSKRKLGGWYLSGGGCMRGKEDRDSRHARVEIGTDTNELTDFGVAQKVETDPRGATPPADGDLGQFSGDPIRFRNEDPFGSYDGNIRMRQQFAYLRRSGWL